MPAASVRIKTRSFFIDYSKFSFLVVKYQVMR